MRLSCDGPLPLFFSSSGGRVVGDILCWRQVVLFRPLRVAKGRSQENAWRSIFPFLDVFSPRVSFPAIDLFRSFTQPHALSWPSFLEVTVEAALLGTYPFLCRRLAAAATWGRNCAWRVRRCLFAHVAGRLPLAKESRWTSLNCTFGRSNRRALTGGRGAVENHGSDPPGPRGDPLQDEVTVIVAT